MNWGLTLTIIAAIALIAAFMFVIEEMKALSNELSDIKWRLYDKNLQIVELKNRIKKLEENNK